MFEENECPMVSNDAGLDHLVPIKCCSILADKRIIKKSAFSYEISTIRACYQLYD